MTLLHLVAEKYGKLPSELLRLWWWEYDFNVAVMDIAADEPDPKKRKHRRPGQPTAAQLARRTGR